MRSRAIVLTMVLSLFVAILAGVARPAGSTRAQEKVTLAGFYSLVAAHENLSEAAEEAFSYPWLGQAAEREDFIATLQEVKDRIAEFRQAMASETDAEPIIGRWLDDADADMAAFETAALAMMESFDESGRVTVEAATAVEGPLDALDVALQEAIWDFEDQVIKVDLRTPELAFALFHENVTNSIAEVYSYPLLGKDPVEKLDALANQRHADAYAYDYIRAAELYAPENAGPMAEFQNVLNLKDEIDQVGIDFMARADAEEQISPIEVQIYEARVDVVLQVLDDFWSNLIGIHEGQTTEREIAAATVAQDPASTPAATAVSLLFVQQATGGTLVSTGADAWTLTLTGVAAHAIYFADRPARAAGTMPTADLVRSTDLFDPTDPPNAAIVLADPNSADADVLIVELREPVYDAAAGTLRYTVTLLGESGGAGLDWWSERADPALPETFGHATIFIDNWVDCLFFPDTCQ